MYEMIKNNWNKILLTLREERKATNDEYRMCLSTLEPTSLKDGKLWVSCKDELALFYLSRKYGIWLSSTLQRIFGIKLDLAFFMEEDEDKFMVYVEGPFGGDEEEELLCEQIKKEWSGFLLMVKEEYKVDSTEFLWISSLEPYTVREKKLFLWWPDSVARDYFSRYKDRIEQIIYDVLDFKLEIVFYENEYKMNCMASYQLKD